MKADLLLPSDSRWRRFLHRVRHDVYHLPGYLSFTARHEAGEPVAFWVSEGEAEFFSPLLLRSLPAALGAPPEWRDATTPYGYPSPLLTPVDAAEALVPILAEFRARLAERDIVTAFFRLHPLLPLPLNSLAKAGEVVRHGQTVTIDLSGTPDSLWSQLRRNHKRGIRRLTSEGFRVEMDDFRWYGNLVDAYRRTMVRVGADKFYLFSDDYFRGLRSSLGPNVLCCSVLAPDGAFACGELFWTVGDIIQSHISGTREGFEALAPRKLLLHAVSLWGQAKGYRHFHLGGGIGGRADSIFLFKAGFSRRRADFYTYRLVADSARYETLNRLWERRCGQVEREEEVDFFPAYRLPCAVE